MTLILGTDSSDTINGTNLDDTINGGRGDDSIHAAAGDDVIYGDRGNNTLAGGNGNDIIYSGRHESTLVGGQGDDILVADLYRGGDHVLTCGQLYKDDGTSSNQFVMTNLNADRMSEVVITDYVHGQDVLLVEDSEIDLTNLPDGYALAASEDGASTILTLGSGDTVTLVDLDFNDITPQVVGNGIVDGTSGDDVIDGATYVDADGESLGETPYVDSVWAYEGNDTITLNTDLVSDYLYFNLQGGDGADVISAFGNEVSAELGGGEGDDSLYAGDGSVYYGFIHMLGGAGEDDFFISTFSQDWVTLGSSASVSIWDFNAGEDQIFIDGKEVTPNSVNDTSLRLIQYYDGFTLIGYSYSDQSGWGETGSISVFGDTWGEFVASFGDGQVDGSAEADLIDAGYTDAEGEMVSDLADLVRANDGDDTVYGYRGNDTIDGGAGNDYLYGIKNNNTLNGGEGDDYLHSGRHASVLDGGQGDDTLVGSLSHGGDHTLTGGGDGDVDTFVVENTMGTRLGDIVVTDFDVAVDVLVIEGETLDVTNLPEAVTLSEAENGDAILTLAAGHTITLQGVAAEDLIIPTPETNGIVDGTDGDDYIDGASFVDQEGDQLTDGDDVVHGNAGDDYIRSDRGDDTLLGGAGNDTLIGVRYNNHLDGGEGDDYLHSGRHASELDGGQGNDTLVGSLSHGGDHTLTGGGEGDVDTFAVENTMGTKLGDIVVTDFDVAVDVLVIEGETLDVTNLPEAVTLSEAENGDAILTLAAGHTITLQGVAAEDLIGVDPTPETNGIVDGTEGDDVIDRTPFVDEDGDQLTDGDDVVYGYGGDDKIVVHRGDDTVYAGDGNDTVIGTKNNDYIDGGNGDDFIELRYHSSVGIAGEGSDRVYLNLTRGADHVVDLTETEPQPDSVFLGFVSMEGEGHLDGRVSDITIHGFDPNLDDISMQPQSAYDMLFWQEDEELNAQSVIGDTTVTFEGVRLEDMQSLNQDILLSDIPMHGEFDEDSFPEEDVPLNYFSLI